VQNLARRLAALPNLVLFPLFFAAVALSHLTLLKLPYYWDEAGYYIPAALDFYRHGWLIPHFTNAHPPLPNILLGTLWHVTGYNILSTRLLVCAFAAVGLLAVFRLTQNLFGAPAAIAVVALTACYPIWFAQSTLAHADIFAAAFTLCAFAIYFRPDKTCHPERSEGPASCPSRKHLILLATLFTLAALSKETAIVQPATLAALELYRLLRKRPASPARLAALSFPVLPLAVWFAWHRFRTGFTFGNPEYLRYNATANFTLPHFLSSVVHRGQHLLWQRNIWLPILFTLACLLLPRRNRSMGPAAWPLTPIFLLIVANWLAFSVLGGALLTRYLLPVYPLILLLCVAVWLERARWWPLLAALTAAAFISALWIDPPTQFAPEDNLTYRDLIVVHQQAVAYIDERYPGATVLTAWPASMELFNPELGYSDRSIKVFPVENFFFNTVQQAAQNPGDYDTALIFPTKYVSPALEHYLLGHPDSARGRDFAKEHDLSPREAALILGGRVEKVFQHNGEWAAVLRFDRNYETRLELNARPFLPATEKVLYTPGITACVASSSSPCSRPSAYPPSRRR
jgi:4-amino-4-deoxy-L-arabinose transferase-like glycosyltransferase